MHLRRPNPTLVLLKIGFTQIRYVITLSNDLFNVYYSYKEAKEIWNSLILKYTTEDVVRQRFVIRNYYHWEMIEDKDIKIQIN